MVGYVDEKSWWQKQAGLFFLVRKNSDNCFLFSVLLFTNSVSTDSHNLLGWVKLPESIFQSASVLSAPSTNLGCMRVAYFIRQLFLLLFQFDLTNNEAPNCGLDSKVETPKIVRLKKQRNPRLTIISLCPIYN